MKIWEIFLICFTGCKNYGIAFKFISFLLILFLIIQNLNSSNRQMPVSIMTFTHGLRMTQKRSSSRKTRVIKTPIKDKPNANGNLKFHFIFIKQYLILIVFKILLFFTLIQILTISINILIFSKNHKINNLCVIILFSRTMQWVNYKFCNHTWKHFKREVERRDFESSTYQRSVFWRRTRLQRIPEWWKYPQ